jgi:hypothetical protein
MVKDRVFVAAAEFGKVQLFCFLSEAKLFTWGQFLLKPSFHLRSIFLIKAKFFHNAGQVF